MFLNLLIEKNQKLINAVVELYENKMIEPDTYVVDLDQTLINAQKILDTANKKNINLYFMLKQIGRNPLIGKELMKLGYKGAVVVDFREAEIMMKYDIPLGNVGHLVQTPKHKLKEIIDYGTEVFTVFTIDKLKEINDAAKLLEKNQDVILKIYDEGDVFYSGQEGGIKLDNLENFIKESQVLSNITIVGVTTFPAYLFNEKTHKLDKTHNYKTIMCAADLLKKCGIDIKQINAPSTTCVYTLSQMDAKVTHGEPGHGLTGTTPGHVYMEMEELPSIVYVSEVSHNFEKFSYAYGGGHYRRSHIKQALVIDDNNHTIHDIVPNDPYAIDYYFKMKNNAPVSSLVLMLFRYQIFVTRSRVAIVKGIQNNNVQLLGIYDSLGKEL